jgi:hypothetical protein
MTVNSSYIPGHGNQSCDIIEAKPLKGWSRTNYWRGSDLTSITATTTSYHLNAHLIGGWDISSAYDWLMIRTLTVKSEPLYSVYSRTQSHVKTHRL